MQREREERVQAYKEGWGQREEKKRQKQEKFQQHEEEDQHNFIIPFIQMGSRHIIGNFLAFSLELHSLH